MIAGEYFDKELEYEALKKYNEGFSNKDFDTLPESKIKQLPPRPKFH